MKYRVDVDGANYTLDVQKRDGQLGYQLVGVHTGAGGWASVVPAGPGVYSVLIDNRSLTISLVRNADSITARVDGRVFHIAISDARDRAARHVDSAAGPLQISSQMPGKIVKLLVKHGEHVQQGQGLIVVEAMKMQNEIKSPKTGYVQTILVKEGATVAGGQGLMVVE